MTAAAADSRSIIRHPPFALFWSARVLSSGAFHMQAVAVGWQVYAMTDSALALGMLGLAQFIPMVLLTLLVGHVADRYDRRAIASICQFVHFAVAVALTTGTLGGWLGPTHIFALVAIVGAARAFESPTMAALVPGLVPDGLISRATAWSASANQTAQILGPAAGGLLYALGPTVAFATACVCFLLAGTATALIRATRTARAREPLTLESLFGGIRFVRGQPIILGTLSLDLFAVLLGGAVGLLPIYARDILETGPWGLGILRASPALGALGMSVVLAHFPLDGKVGAKLFAAVILFGAATIVFGLSTNLLLSIAALMTLGAADVISVVIRFSLVQLRTPDEMRGRVSALNSMFIGTSNQLGEFESGVTAALFGAVPAVLLGGAGTILVALIWMRLFPELRSIEKL